jgi:hypothetical protein
VGRPQGSVANPAECHDQRDTALMKVKGTIWLLSDPHEPLLFLNSKVPLL